MQQIVRNSNPSFFNFLFKITFFLLLTSNLNGQNKLVYGIERTDQYIKFLSDKKIGLVTNHTSKFYTNKPIHLVDSLINRGIEIVRIFSPEHGFRGDIDNGEKIENSVDLKTKIPIVSLYGNSRKPTPDDISELELIIFDRNPKVATMIAILSNNILQQSIIDFKLKYIFKRFYLA